MITSGDDSCVKSITNFELSDVGEGWFGVISPLHCQVLDGPAPHRGSGRLALYWLAQSADFILIGPWLTNEEHQQDKEVAEPASRTDKIVVIAEGHGVPVTGYTVMYPVALSATSLADAIVQESLGIIVGFRRSFAEESDD